jgi:hypothetical protein
MFKARRGPGRLALLKDDRERYLRWVEQHVYAVEMDVQYPCPQASVQNLMG